MIFFGKIQFFSFLIIDIFPIVRPIKHIANFSRNAMAIPRPFYLGIEQTVPFGQAPDNLSVPGEIFACPGISLLWNDLTLLN